MTEDREGLAAARKELAAAFAAAASALDRALSLMDGVAQEHSLCPEGQPKLYTVTDAAAYLGVSRTAMFKLLREGRVPAGQLTERGDRMVRREDLDAFARELAGSDRGPTPINRRRRAG